MNKVNMWCQAAQFLARATLQQLPPGEFNAMIP